jgi:antitoxin PrlF
MKIGERGQVTIPKKIRDRLGLRPRTEVEFALHNGQVVLKKAPRKLNLQKWRGKCRESFANLGYKSVDEYIEDVRGR